MSVFRDYAKYYDLLYKDKDYRAEVSYIHAIIKSLKNDARSILNIGCGTGKHDVLLAEYGYAIKGVDLSQTMIERAKEFQHDGLLEFEVADARTFRSNSEYDVVISLFHVINYQCSNNDLLAFFKTAHIHLKHNGVFIFDSWYGPALLSDKPYEKTKEMEDDDVRVFRKTVPVIDYNKNIAHINFDIEIFNKHTSQLHKLNEKHSMRYLFLPEVEQLADSVGFKIVRFTKWMTDEVPGENSWYVLYALIKNN